MYVPPIEVIETVNVSSNNFDAEQGFAGGAAVTVTTKSGTNQLHGVAFESLNNWEQAWLCFGKVKQRFGAAFTLTAAT